MKKVTRISGVIFLILGIIFLSNSISGITGFVVIEEVKKNISGILGLVLVLVGVLIMVAKKSKMPLEKIVFVSKQAVERSEKDLRVKQDMQKYANEIRMITADPTHRPQEMIGEFHVSPRGHKDIRVAWHRKIDEEQGKEIIYIDDYLYHINDTDYVDLWNKRAAKREIKREDYEFD